MSKCLQRVVPRFNDTVSILIKKQGDSFIVKRIKLFEFGHFVLLVMLDDFYMTLIK